MTNDGGIPFWDAYKQFGGPEVLGYPVTKRFVYDGFITQAMQKVVFQWRPEVGRRLLPEHLRRPPRQGQGRLAAELPPDPPALRHRPGRGPLLGAGGIAPPGDAGPEPAPSRRPTSPTADPIAHFGLPVSYADMGNSFVIRAQRATFQYWKENVPWAKQGEVTVANGGDLAKEIGLWPEEAATPGFAPLQPVVLIAGTPRRSAHCSTPTAASGLPRHGHADRDRHPIRLPDCHGHAVLCAAGPRRPDVYRARAPSTG